MEASTDMAAQLPNSVADDSIVEQPVTPPEHDIIVPESSQVTLASTEVPPSPIEPNASFKTENNDDRIPSSNVIPSSLTPPPSSQAPTHNRNGTLPAALLVPQNSHFYSPPATGLNGRRDSAASHADYVAPNPQHVLEASADELRAMVQTCIADHARLKMEAAHHKLQYNLLSLQADEDAKRAEVEHEMMLREVEALRTAEYSAQARREMSAATESAQLKYLRMKGLYEDVVEENESLARRFKAAKKLLSQKEDEIGGLLEDRDMLLNRIRENREHFQMLTSPGGMLHSALGASTPKQNVVTTPHRTAARQTPKPAQRESRADPGQESMAALLQALSQDNNSAPTTPTSVNRQGHRIISRHTRNAQSLSSLPATPARQANPEGLLPSADLVPQHMQHDYTPNLKNFSLRSPVQRRQGSPRPQSQPQTQPQTQPHSQSQNPSLQQPQNQRASAGRKSRESTISAAEDSNNEELARQALESVAKSASFFSQASRGSSGSRRPLPNRDDDEEDVSASQASQAASDMLRRDPRESSEVAASRDVSPRSAEKSGRAQAKLLSEVAHNGGEKRKLSGSAPLHEEPRQGHASPPKKMRYAAQGGEAPRVGLGIQYSQR